MKLKQDAEIVQGYVCIRILNKMDLRCRYYKASGAHLQQLVADLASGGIIFENPVQNLTEMLATLRDVSCLTVDIVLCHGPLMQTSNSPEDFIYN